MSNNQLLQHIEENIQIINESFGTSMATGAVLGAAAGAMEASFSPDVSKARSDWKRAQKMADILSNKTKTKEDKHKYETAKRKASYAEKKFRKLRKRHRVLGVVGGGAAGAALGGRIHNYNHRVGY